MNADPAERKLPVAFLPAEDEEHRHGGNELRNGGADAYAHHAEPVSDDQPEVDRHVDEPRAREDEKGAFGVAAGAQDRRAEVIDHRKRHADEIDLQINRRLIDDEFVGVHEFQKEPRAEKPDDPHKDSAEKTHGYGGVHHFIRLFPIARADATGHHRKRAHAQPDEQVDDEVDEGTRRADRRHRGVVGELPHGDNVRSVV